VILYRGHKIIPLRHGEFILGYAVAALVGTPFATLARAKAAIDQLV
jgi:hypothetical protein